MNSRRPIAAITSRDPLLNRVLGKIAAWQNRTGKTFAEGWDAFRRAEPEAFGLPARTTDPVVRLCNRLRLENDDGFEANWERARNEVFSNGRPRPAAGSMLVNRAFTPSADGWIEIVRTGEFPHSSGVVQVIDAPALGSMLHLFNLDRAKPNFPGLLIDFEHWSYEPDKSSEAAAWIYEMRIDGDRLMARPDWTEAGEKALTSGRYRLLSPTFDAQNAEDLGNQRVRPLRLDSVGVTNSPNIKGGTPLSR